MVRAFFCMVWAGVFFMLSGLGLAFAAAGTAGSTPETQQLAARKAGEQLGPPALLGSIGLAVVLGAAGVLPGTRSNVPKLAEGGPRDLPLLQSSHNDAVAPIAQGPPPSEHRFTFWGFLDRWSRMLTGVPLFSVLGLAIAGCAPNDPNAVLMGLAFLALGVLPFFFLVGRFFGMRRVRLDAEGVTWEGAFGSSFRPWTEIRTVWREESIVNRRYRTRKVTLKFTGGGSVTFDQSLTDYSDLAETIMRVTFDPLSRIARNELRQSGEARFGPVSIRPDGIVMTGKFFPWNGLSRYEILNGHILLYRALRPRAKADREVKLRELPNYHVVLGMLADSGVPMR